MADQDSILLALNYYLTIYKTQSSTYDFKDQTSVTFDVYEFTGEEYVNDDFLYNIQIVSEEHINIANLLNIEAELQIQVNTKKRNIKGYVSAIKASAKVGRYFIYNLKLTSWLEYLKHVKYSRIYHKLPTKDIIQKAVSEVQDQLGISCDLAFKLSTRNKNAYPIKEHCVQYDETVYNFIFRLLEEEGMFIQIDKNTITILDDNPTGDATINAIVNEELSIISSNITYNSYDYEHTNHNFKINKQARTDSDNQSEIDTAGMNNLLSTNIFIDRLDTLEKDDSLTKYLQNKAEIEINRNMVLSKTMNGSTKDLNSYAGLTCIINDVTNGTEPFKQKSMIISSKYVGTKHNSLQEYSNNDTGGMFSSDFTFIKDTIYYKPPLKRYKNKINSKQIAVIGGLGDEEHYIDDMGRVKVQFFWNEKIPTSKDQNSLSCWVRLSHVWNGDQGGSMFIPSVGQEVLVTFVNGDPDYPIVDGMLYNSKNKAKNDWKDTVNQWSITSKSSGKDTSNDNFSQIMFDSTHGKELIHLQSEKDFTSVVKNDETKTISKNHNVTVDNDQTIQVKKNQVINIGSNQNINVHKNYSLAVTNSLKQEAQNSVENVSKNKVVSVAENLTTEVVKTSLFTVKGVHKNIFQNLYKANFKLNSTRYYKSSNFTNIAKDNFMEITGSSLYKIGKNLHINTKGTLKIKSDNNIQIESAKGISLHAGSNLITINKDSIFIKGSKVKINSGGSVLKAKEVKPPEIEEPKNSMLKVVGLEITGTRNKQKKGKKQLVCKIKVQRWKDGSWVDATQLSAIEKSQITCEALYSNPKSEMESLLVPLQITKPFEFRVLPLKEHIYQNLDIFAYVEKKKEGKTIPFPLERDLKIIDLVISKKNTYTAKTNLESLTDKEKKLIYWQVEYEDKTAKKDKEDKKDDKPTLTKKDMDKHSDVLSYKTQKKHRVIAYEQTYFHYVSLCDGKKEDGTIEVVTSKHLPKSGENGTWTGTRGDSEWKPKPDDNIKTPKDCSKTWKDLLTKDPVGGIRFENGDPIFTPYAVAKVKIDKFEGERYKNFAKADTLLVNQINSISHNGNPVPIRSRDMAKKVRSKKHFTWHERDIAGNMELVTSKIHGNIPHSGGISALKQITNH